MGETEGRVYKKREGNCDPDVVYIIIYLCNNFIYLFW